MAFPPHPARLLARPRPATAITRAAQRPHSSRRPRVHRSGLAAIAALVALCAAAASPELLAAVHAEAIQPVPGLSTADDVALAEKAALLSLASALNNHPAFAWAGWTSASQGLSASDSKPCVQFWEFLSCDSDGRVSSINIDNPTLGTINASWANQKAPGGLSGSIPWDSLTVLQRLQAVDLSGNSISGPPFTPAISQFTELREIQLAGNRLDAPVASQASELFNLQKLDLSNNLIPGALPAGLSALTALEVLSLSSNQLADSFPLGLSALTALKQLELGNNNFNGPLPDQWSTLTGLQLLDLAGAGVVLPLPDSWAALSSLETLSLQNNNLTAPFPAFLLQLPSISDVTLFNNSLYGSLPATLWNPTKLTLVEVSSNFLNGSVPQPPAGRSADFSYSTNCLQSAPSQRPTDQCSSFYSNLPALVQAAAEKARSKGCSAVSSLQSAAAAAAAAAALLASLSLALMH
ncbi:hypothetical protein CLOM_g8488 [Closterium sp. NIES-68]|nr:hypothetical protein CLOM_g1762 [Closterium sp. NIES-68]GJP49249.1 hypothetical protein CLOM_g8488 [Closterium sp. NIES-68]GJP78339.1 hypothetical protein CLOP_g8657 [Closterium sp. NIES-67]